ncbi:general secretion pathway protein N [Sphingomonas jinjuensis]|uniref:Type II secretion system protein N n=1 Tax=Sphingomonas jinjuensis TaxID=535907 RepID=A0A840FI58_9SPHN|nr:type II secretion system protein N [Sphingomonas jinjuensis]MBB4153035.1 general secretion pathway protein N [Sphingomonas jinjuensis]
MMRLRLSTGPAALFGAMMLAALLFFLPLRLVLGWAGVGEAGLTARRVGGIVWDGRLYDARFGDLMLGDVDAGLSPLDLLIGRARITLAGRGTQPLAGSLLVSRHVSGIDHMTASLPTGRVFAPVPVTRLDLDDVSIRFVDGRCENAEGRVRATLIGDAAGIALPGSVSGTARCEGGALLLPLASQPGTESVMLRITGEGRYTAALTLAQPDPLAAQRLAAAGFVQGPQGYRLSIEGSF